MTRGRIEPSTNLSSFNCPKCGAEAHQVWYQCFAERFEDNKKPIIWTDKEVDDILEGVGKEAVVDHEEYLRPFTKGIPYLYKRNEYYSINQNLHNVHLSRCHSCDEISMWIYGKLVYPPLQRGPEPNPDIPSDILEDYIEASSILDLSPRGAAALLRLAVQKLCIHLGEPGKNINDDIGSLVAKGLSTKVQKALDTVRVIGNHAVHPGKIDLKDDRETAGKLFGLINIITDIMISQDKHIDALYEEKVPETTRAAIEERDTKTDETE